MLLGVRGGLLREGVRGWEGGIGGGRLVCWKTGHVCVARDCIACHVQPQDERSVGGV